MSPPNQPGQNEGKWRAWSRELREKALKMSPEQTVAFVQSEEFRSLTAEDQQRVWRSVGAVGKRPTASSQTTNPAADQNASRRPLAFTAAKRRVGRRLPFWEGELANAIFAAIIWSGGILVIGLIAVKLFENSQPMF